MKLKKVIFLILIIISLFSNLLNNKKLIKIPKIINVIRNFNKFL